MTIPLPTLFARALSSASKASNLQNVDDVTQDLIQSALRDLNTLNAQIDALSLFSPNEQLEDISTADLVFLLVPYVYAEVRVLVRTTEREERMVAINHSRSHLQTFLSNLENYGIVPESERSLQEKRSSSIGDPASRREWKIKQYKKEKELRARIETVRKRRRQVPANDSDGQTDFDLMLFLLPSSFQNTSASDEDDSDTEEILREATLYLLRLAYAQTHSHLENMNQELELLRTAPLPPVQPPEDDRRSRSQESEDMWRLDSPAQGGTGPILDESGRVLRPVTILPSRATDRARLQAQVFGPGHNLPTMSIDEYLEIERQRGNIMAGGGSQSIEMPTSSEQLALDAEMDGMALGEEKAEEKRLKDEKWARFTDENPRGQGNTMNRG